MSLRQPQGVRVRKGVLGRWGRARREGKKGRRRKSTIWGAKEEIVLTRGLPRVW